MSTTSLWSIIDKEFFDRNNRATFTRYISSQFSFLPRSSTHPKMSDGFANTMSAMIFPNSRPIVFLLHPN
jgi:hypothetical protein